MSLLWEARQQAVVMVRRSILKISIKFPAVVACGSAAAVAGGIALAALGSDTGGSIRQPASFCGCVGLKPTYGRVSRYGLVAYSSSLDQIGPITQNVTDCAILFDAISGYDKMDSTSANLVPTKIHKNLNPNTKMKIAILPNLLKDADANIQNAYQKTIDRLSKDGHTIVEKEMLDTSYIISAYYVICTAEASSNLARFDGVRYGNRAKDVNNLKELYFKTRSQGFGDEVKNRILLGSFVLSSGYYDAYYIKAQKVRTLIARQYSEILKECDAILSPVAPSTAFGFDECKSPLQMYLEDIYTIGVNLAGLPALSLPVSEDDGMPIGMQLIGDSFAEQKILDLGLNLENLCKEGFMKIRARALTFEDVLLVPAYSEILPKEVSLQTKFSKNITLNSPLVSAAMDTVTEYRTAIAMARVGGIGIIHKNMDINSQVAQIKKVKKKRKWRNY